MLEGLTLTENGEYVFKTAHEVISKLERGRNIIREIKKINQLEN